MANFILLPATQTQTNDDTNPKVKDFLTTVLEPAVRSASLKLNARMPAKESKKIPVKVLDSIQDDGAKLVELSDDELADFRFSYPGFRIIKEKFYRKAIIYREAVIKKVRAERRPSPPAPYKLPLSKRLMGRTKPTSSLISLI